MDEIVLRKQILNACKYLIKHKLIARTWGNVSCRLDDKRFIITPSGLAYDKTSIDDLVIVNIDDCSYDKNQRKPSSEKLIHSCAYKLRKDCNFIIHTHQHYASALCAKQKDIVIGKITIPCAEYGLPGTKKLQHNCEESFVKNENSNMFLMANHGALVFGKDYDEAIKNVTNLEKLSKKEFESKVKEFYVPQNMKAYLDDYSQLFPLDLIDDEEAIEIVRNKNAAAALYAYDVKPINFIDHKIQHLVYKLKYSKMRDK